VAIGRSVHGVQSVRPNKNVCTVVVKQWLYSTGVYTERERAVVRAASNRFRAIIVVFYVW